MKTARVREGTPYAAAVLATAVITALGRFGRGTGYSCTHTVVPLTIEGGGADSR